jgi:hypothetical protein
MFNVITYGAGIVGGFGPSSFCAKGVKRALLLPAVPQRLRLTAAELPLRQIETH